MVHVCCVRGCQSSYRLSPYVTLTRFLSQNTKYPDLVEKRKNSWLRALRLDEPASLVNMRVCSRHFIKGKPAKLVDISNPDWIPSLNLEPCDASEKNTCHFKQEEKHTQQTRKSTSKQVSFAKPCIAAQSIDTPMDYDEDSTESEDSYESSTSKPTTTNDPISTKDPANSSMQAKKKICDVFNCTKDSINFPELGFHSFPRDDYRRQIWIDFCGREDDWYPKTTSKICSTHFQTDDYELASLMGFKRKNALKPGVCPSMYVESIEQDDDETKKQSEISRDFNIQIPQENIKEEKKMSDICCSVENCKNNFARNGDKLQFHKFPKSPVKRKTWTRFCQKGSEWRPKKRSRICSEHFKDTDYENLHLGPLEAKLNEWANPSKSHKSNKLISKKRRVMVSDDEEAENIFGVVSKSEHCEVVNENRELNKEITELKATVAKLLKTNKNMYEKIENQITYIESVENMWKINNQRIKELEDFLNDLSELHKEQKNNDPAHLERVKQIDLMLSKPSIKCNCKIMKMPRDCTICNLVFSSKAQFDLHVRNVHSRQHFYKCHLCVRSFSIQSALTQHLKRHPANNKQRQKFTCNVCNKRFDDSSNLEAHLLEHHNNNAATSENNSADTAEITPGDTNFGVLIVENESVSSSSVMKTEVGNDLDCVKDDLLNKGFDVVIEYPPDHQYSRKA